MFGGWFTAPTEMHSGNSARQRVIDWLRPYFPDIEMAPGSTLGDLYVSPCAAFVAAVEVAQGRFMSDLDLENVANNVIYSCDFVQRYLGNFAVYDVATLQSTGIVRLTFTSNTTRTLNKGVRFKFGTNDEFSLRLPDSATDDITLLPAGTIPSTDPNQFVLAQTSLNTWAVDLPVTGKMTSDVARGAEGTATTVPADLVGIVAAVDFDYGLPPTSLPDLAKMARRTAYAASVGSRNGTRAFVFQQWPETSVISPVLTGDAEMQRDSPASAIILQQPAADLYYRSKRDLQQETQVVKLLFDGEKFRGLVPLLHRPSRIGSMLWAGDLDLPMDTVTFYSEITRGDLPGSTGAGTRYERLWVEIIPPTDEDGVILVDRVNDEDDHPYAMFQVTYAADPLLEAVSQFMEAPDNVPAGVDVLVKTGPLIELSQLEIRYRKKPGITMTLDAARTWIADYVNAAGYPEIYSEGPLNEAMGYAGAARVEAILYTGTLTVSAASRRFNPEFDPSADPDWNDNSVGCPTSVVNSFATMKPDIVVSTGSEKYAATDRTIRYHLAPENILFTEVR